jgi:hypothetical protein
MRAEPSPPPRESCLVVFAQRSDARIDLPAWSRHAERFFGTSLGLAVEKSYGDAAPVVDAAEFVLSHAGSPATRQAFARPREPEDLELARAAEARSGGGGLVLLAGRCRMVWMVARESLADASALRLAAILASILLGPILDVTAGQLFGVKTARGKLGS